MVTGNERRYVAIARVPIKSRVRSQSRAAFKTRLARANPDLIESRDRGSEE